MTAVHETSRRDGYRDQTRARILDAATAELAESALEAMTMATIARRAGVTERTVFRHFATRDQLLASVWRHLQHRVGSPGFPVTAEAMIQTPLKLFPEFDKEQRLILASAYSAGGREVRLKSNDQRQQAMRACVRDAFPGIEEPSLTRLAAIAQLIDSAYAWAVLKEFWDMSGEEAGLAASEALGVLLGKRPPGSQTPGRGRRKEKTE